MVAALQAASTPRNDAQQGLPPSPGTGSRRCARKPGARPDGAVSIGTPVDPVPGLIRDALAAASDAPGYPATWGTPRLRSAAALARAHGVPVSPDDVLPVVGTKEFIAWLRSCSASGRVTWCCSPDWRTHVRHRRAAGRGLGGRGQPAGRGHPMGRSGLGELAVQPDRPGAAGRAPAQGGGLGQRTRRGGGVRRVLHLAGLGCRAGFRAASRRARRRSHNSVLAVHSLSSAPTWPVTAPGSRRPGAGRDLLAIRRKRRPDHAGPGAGGDGGGAVRRIARGGAAGSRPGGPSCWRPSPASWPWTS